MPKRNCLEHDPANAIENGIKQELHHKAGDEFKKCFEHGFERPNVVGKGRCATLYRAASSGGRRPERP